MSGKKSKSKGRAGELEWAKLTGGERISRTGEPGPDVSHPPMIVGPITTAEVKRVAKMPAILRSWLAQAREEGADYVAFREDRGPWYVVMEADDVQELRP